MATPSPFSTKVSKKNSGFKEIIARRRFGIVVDPVKVAG
jgi:hypothetical protein